MIVAIHQPNYAPWLGYFHKLHVADIFVFLDDAQFSKNSYTNRVQILDQGRPAWLTVPAKPSLGTKISDVVPGQSDWPKRHLSRLSNAYRKAPHFREVWPSVEEILGTAPAGNLCASNSHIIAMIADRLSLECRIVRASSYPNSNMLAGGSRLADLIRQTRCEGPVYLSGRGGQNYQDEEVFRSSGIELRYTNFECRPYPQIGCADQTSFVPGLGVFDALLNTGWDATRALVAAEASSV